MAQFERFPRKPDQASRLRQLVAGTAAGRVSNRSGTHVIAVASGKGGVGKTFIATNLSIALAGQGHRVILFDMDMGLANADIVLGVEAAGTWSDVISGHRGVDEIVVEAPGGIAFVPGSSGIAHLADLSEFERHKLLAAMERVEVRYDIAVLDCGAGISRNVLSFIAAADTVLVITTPEPTALTDGYALIKAFAQMASLRTAPFDPCGCLGVVVNEAASRREARATYERLAGVAARFLHQVVADYGYILRDEHVPSAVLRRAPAILQYPRSPAGACLTDLASRLSREIGRPEADQGLLYRVMNLFM